MRKSGIIFGLFVSMLVAVSAFAGEVNLPHTFQPNTKAKASEVNVNFEAVRDAVNDNNSRIQSLESFKCNVAGSSCASGNAVTGFSADGTPQCEDMNKEKNTFCYVPWILLWSSWFSEKITSGFYFCSRICVFARHE